MGASHRLSLIKNGGTSGKVHQHFYSYKVQCLSSRKKLINHYIKLISKWQIDKVIIYLNNKEIILFSALQNEVPGTVSTCNPY